jgi:hypothetical protein
MPVHLRPDVLTLASAVIVKEPEKLAKLFKGAFEQRRLLPGSAHEAAAGGLRH